jgi:hypothetical protein
MGQYFLCDIFDVFRWLILDIVFHVSILFLFFPKQSLIVFCQSLWLRKTCGVHVPNIRLI